MKKLLVLIIVLILAGCGRKGPMKPPEAMVPAPVADLRVGQQGEQFLVSWSRPSGEEGGGALRDLAMFQLFRRVVLPPGEDCEECPDAYRLVKIVDLEYPQGVVISGARYFLYDAEPALGTAYRYKVVSLKKDGTESRASNRAGAKRVAPPLPPSVAAASSLNSVVLTWKGGTPSPGGSVEGYNIYRKTGDGQVYLTPLTGAPVKGETFTDTHLEWGKQYVYAVRTVARVAGETVESDLSNEVRGALAEPD
jgi:predicted small lipoprotein YifL/fibronectin type 3 domain-containing protein